MSLAQALPQWKWYIILVPSTYADSQSIVAIHGLQGHSISTWTHSNSNVFWLRDLLPENVKNARIMTFGYNADVWLSRSTLDVDNHCSNLFANLIDVRETDEVRFQPQRLRPSIKQDFPQEKERPIIFIAHSLGGMLLKKVGR